MITPQLKLKVRMTFTEPMLGTKPANPEVFAAYIASKRPDGPAKDELETAESAEIQGTTGFHKDARGNPMIWNYQIRGYFKESWGAMRNISGSVSDNIATHKSKIDLLVFVFPRLIPLILPPGGAIGVCERSLRAETMQGPRTTVVRSEEVPVGTTMDFEVHALTDVVKDKNKKPVRFLDLITEWMDYGVYHGFGQWRNSGKGVFTYEFSQVGRE